MRRAMGGSWARGRERDCSEFQGASCDASVIQAPLVDFPREVTCISRRVHLFVAIARLSPSSLPLNSHLMHAYQPLYEHPALHSLPAIPSICSGPSSALTRLDNGGIHFAQNDPEAAIVCILAGVI